MPSLRTLTLAAVLATSLAAAPAHADTVALTGQQGVYTFNGASSATFTVSLDTPGVYDFSSLLAIAPGSDHNYRLSPDATGISVGGATPTVYVWSGRSGSASGEFTLTGPTVVSIDVSSNYRRKEHGHSTLGGYSGSFTLQPVAAPVPEPASAALMLVGLGAVGLLARRRRG